MAWKTESLGVDYSYRTRAPLPEPPKRQQGSIVAHVRKKNTLESQLEKVYKIDSALVGYNSGDNRVLIKVPQNDKSFDEFIGLPFTKGVTERKTGRTLLILGSAAHHIEAIQGQFDNVLWQKTEEDETKKYGNTIRWINVGTLKEGFIGLDYNPKAENEAGVAQSSLDVKFLASTLIAYGFNGKKHLFLLKPPYMVESEQGVALRKSGLTTLEDFAKKDDWFIDKALKKT